MNAQVVSWHLIEDVLGWLAVLIVSIIMIFTDLPILDPILSILIAIFILIKVIGNLKRTVELFLQAVPDSMKLDEINQELEGIRNVRSIHHTHIWTLDGLHHVLTTHVVVPDETSKEQVMSIKAEMRDMLSEYDISHITVEIEYGDTDCIMSGL